MSKSEELFKVLWDAADVMRQKMSADVYKDYLLGLVFYKALTDKYLLTASDLLELGTDITIAEAQQNYENAQSSDIFADLSEELKNTYGCVINPEFTFQSFVNKVNSSNFTLDELSQAFRNIELSNGKVYAGLFDDFDVQSKDLGKEPIDRNRLIGSVIKSLSNINFTDYGDDALGDAYEYLISQFASESGKKAGEFYIRLFQNLFNVDVCNNCTCKVS